MTKPIPKELSISINADVLETLQGKSCHSDIVIPVQQCLMQYSDVSSFSPDGKNYSYVCWYVNNVIFAYATGMKMVSIKLEQAAIGTLNLKEEVDSFYGKEWYFVSYDFEGLGILVESAYESAKNS